MSSLQNFHRAVAERVSAGDLQLGVSKMAGADPGSLAFSRFWTSFPYLFTAGYAGALWLLAGPWWGFVLGVPAAWFFAVYVRQKREMRKTRRLAMSCPVSFDQLWDEGALSLRLPHGDAVCLSPHGDYRGFMVEHFLSPGIQESQQSSAERQPDADGWITLGPDAHVTRLRPGEKL